jgi:tRNA(Ile)-lysidine synthase
MIMQQTVTEFIEQRQLLTKNATVLIAVSGGPDSMALLHFYQSIRKEWNLKLIAISVDHQLRGEDSRGDLNYVRSICKSWHVKFVSTAVDVRAYKQARRVGTQVAARDVRYRFFAEQMEAHQADYLALGHHADDQIETMLMGFVRSASPNALSGIPIKRKFATGYIVRPFLCLKKTDLVKYCEENQITARVDSSNEDTTYTRNYFRKHIIPMLKEKNSNIHTTLQRLSESLQIDEKFVENEAKKMVDTVVSLEEHQKQVSFEISLFKSYPLSLQRRGYHLILDYLYNRLPGNLSYVHEDAFFTLLETGKSNVTINFPRRLQVEKSYEQIIFSFLDSNPQNSAFQKVLHIPSKIDLPNGSKLIASYTKAPLQAGDYFWACDAEKIALPLHIRTRQPGDRMSWAGLNGRKKIKDIFIDAKIPRKDRDTWPLVVDAQGEVLWMIGLRKGRQVLQTKEDSLYIQLEYIK